MTKRTATGVQVVGSETAGGDGTGAQYYVFRTGTPQLPVGVEGFDDLGHWAAPSPLMSVGAALDDLSVRYPGAVVDVLFYGDEIAEARELLASAACLPWER